MDGLEQVFKMFYSNICNAAKYIYATKIIISLIKNTGDKNFENGLKDVMYGGASYALLNSVLAILNSIQKQFD